MNIIPVVGRGGAIVYWAALRGMSVETPVLCDVGFDNALSGSGDGLIQALGDTTDLQRCLTSQRLKVGPAPFRAPPQS